MKQIMSLGITRSDEDSFSNYYEDGLVVILIDMQQIFLDGLKKKNRERIIANQIFVIKWCVQENIPIIVLEYIGYGETINSLSKELESVKDLKIVPKSNTNGFCDTELASILNRINAKNLFLMGFDANVCVKSTARGAREEGYGVITNKDVIDGVHKDNSGISWYIENGTVVSVKDLTNT
ncbi:MAG: isochorismatase family cysteine hydrolase [Patescibacteria group bacterium]|nr:isochorismatase family cysteine hydrolase [Patescibacteria group bacterium]